MVIYISLGLICGVLCPIVAWFKHKSVASAVLWFFAGLFFPVLSLIVVAILPSRASSGESDTMRGTMIAEIAVHKAQNWDPNKYISNEKWNDPINNDQKNWQKPSFGNENAAYWYKCQNCSKKMKGKKSLDGKKVKCPACKEPFLAVIVGTVKQAY